MVTDRDHKAEAAVKRRRISGMQRAAMLRERQLARIREQVAEGRLVIRQATTAERKRYGIKPDGG